MPVPDRPVSFLRLRTQFENAGDCLIHRELVRLASERGDVSVDTSACPPEFARQVLSGVAPGRLLPSSLPFFPRMLAAAATGRRCIWFLTPGGISGPPPYEKAWPTWLREAPLPIASAAGVRICHVGASFQSLTDAHVARWRYRSRWLFRMSPRDSISAAYLRSLEIPCDPCVPDLAFNLFRETRSGGEISGVRARAACLSFRTDGPPGQADHLASVAEAVCASRPELRWRPMVQVARDLDGMDLLRRRLLRAGFDLDPVADLHDDVESCLAFFREVSLVVSNRLHVLLLGASQGARIVAVAEGPSGPRLTGILRDLGLGGAILSPAPGAQDPLERTNGFVIDGSAARERLARAFDEIFA